MSLAICCLRDTTPGLVRELGDGYDGAGRGDSVRGKDGLRSPPAAA